MRRITALVGIIVLATGAMALAQTPPTPQERPQQQQQAEKSFMGEIASVNADAKTITVKESQAGAARPESPAQPPAQPGQRQEAMGKSMTFSIDNSTKITSKVAKTQPTTPSPTERPAGPSAAGEEIELQDLKEGDRVSVKYTESAGKNVAKSVELVSRGATSN